MESVHAEDRAGPSDVGSEPCEESPAPPAKKARVKKVSLEELAGIEPKLITASAGEPM